MRLGQLFVKVANPGQPVAPAAPKRDWNSYKPSWQAQGTKALQEAGAPTPTPRPTPVKPAYTPFADTDAGKQFYNKWNATRTGMREQGAQNAAEMAKLHARLDQVDAWTKNPSQWRRGATPALGVTPGVEAAGEAAAAQYRSNPAKAVGNTYRPINWGRIQRATGWDSGVRTEAGNQFLVDSHFGSTQQQDREAYLDKAKQLRHWHSLAPWLQNRMRRPSVPQPGQQVASPYWSW